MNTKSSLLLCIISLGVVRPCHADGCIFQLPTAGASATFKIESAGKVKVLLPDGTEPSLPPEAKAQLEAMSNIRHTGSLRIASTGNEVRNGQPCRWLEMQWRTGATGAPPMENILKLLVLESQMARGRDPLDHPLLAVFNAKQADQAGSTTEQGFDRIQYEIDRFRPIFPPPLKNQRSTGRRTIHTAAGDFPDCEIIAGTTDWHWPLVAGSWKSESTWEIALHPKAPFGVVVLKGESRTREFGRTAITETAIRTVLTLESTGTEAKGLSPAK